MANMKEEMLKWLTVERSDPGPTPISMTEQSDVGAFKALQPGRQVEILRRLNYSESKAPKVARAICEGAWNKLPQNIQQAIRNEMVRR